MGGLEGEGGLETEMYKGRNQNKQKTTLLSLHLDLVWPVSTTNSVVSTDVAGTGHYSRYWSFSQRRNTHFCGKIK